MDNFWRILENFGEFWGRGESVFKKIFRKFLFSKYLC